MTNIYLYSLLKAQQHSTEGENNSDSKDKRMETDKRKGNIKANAKKQTTVLKSQRGWKLRGTRYWGDYTI